MQSASTPHMLLEPSEMSAVREVVREVREVVLGGECGA